MQFPVINPVIVLKIIAGIAIESNIFKPNRCWTDCESSQQRCQSLRYSINVSELYMDYANSGDISFNVAKIVREYCELHEIFSK